VALKRKFVVFVVVVVYDPDEDRILHVRQPFPEVPPPLPPLAIRGGSVAFRTVDLLKAHPPPPPTDPPAPPPLGPFTTDVVGRYEIDCMIKIMMMVDLSWKALYLYSYIL
jgi:hypothetical protein